MRILAGGYDQVHLWWQVLEQKGESIINRFGINSVVVVKDEDEIVRDDDDLIEQGRQNRFSWRWLRGLDINNNQALCILGGAQGPVHVQMDLATGKTEEVFTQHTNGITSVSISADGRSTVAGFRCCPPWRNS